MLPPFFFLPPFDATPPFCWLSILPRFLPPARSPRLRRFRASFLSPPAQAPPPYASHCAAFTRRYAAGVSAADFSAFDIVMPRFYAADAPVSLFRRRTFSLIRSAIMLLLPLPCRFDADNIDYLPPLRHTITPFAISLLFFR